MNYPLFGWTFGSGFAYKALRVRGAIQRKEKHLGIEESDQATQEEQEARTHKNTLASESD
jgi:hypothetical protein